MAAPARSANASSSSKRKLAVAAAARVRRLAARVAGDERVDDGAAELLAQVERHVRQPERVAGLARGDHGLGRAAGALGVGPGRVEPEPQRDPDRLRPGPQQRDGAVDAAAHRDRDPARVGLGAEDLRERVRERVGGERLPGDGGGLEQRQAGERPLEPGRVGLDDPVAVDDEPHERELLAPRGISEDLDHAGQASGSSFCSWEAGRPFRGLARSGSAPADPDPAPRKLLHPADASLRRCEPG